MIKNTSFISRLNNISLCSMIWFSITLFIVLNLKKYLFILLQIMVVTASITG